MTGFDPAPRSASSARGRQPHSEFEAVSRARRTMSYNGIGLQTTRGSGTNGYVQTNKFHRSASRLQRTEWRDLKDIHGAGPKSNKPNEEILAHQRKREIEVKLAQLEDDLEEKGVDAEEIAERLKEARVKFEREAERKSGPGP